MKVIIIILSTLFVVGFIVLVVYLILTLKQIQATAKEAEQVLKKINRNLDNVTSITDQAKTVIGSTVPIIVSLLTGITTGIFKFLGNLFFKRGKQS